MAMEADLPSVDVSVPHAKAAVDTVEKKSENTENAKDTEISLICDLSIFFSCQDASFPGKCP